MTNRIIRGFNRIGIGVAVLVVLFGVTTTAVISTSLYFRLQKIETDRWTAMQNAAQPVPDSPRVSDMPLLDELRTQLRDRDNPVAPASRDLHITEEVAQLDAWIAEQKERFGVEFSRPDAVRVRLAQTETTGELASKPRRPKGKD